MSQTQQLIEQVRQKLDGATDYRIAQVLDIPRNLMHYYAKGERDADAYACAKFAEVLDRDPLEVIAQVEAEAARSEKKREYWRSFFSGLKRTAHGIALCVIAIGFGTGPSTGHATSEASSHNVYYVKLRQNLGWARQASPLEIRARPSSYHVAAINSCRKVNTAREAAWQRDLACKGGS